MAREGRQWPERFDPLSQPPFELPRSSRPTRGPQSGRARPRTGKSLLIGIRCCANAYEASKNGNILTKGLSVGKEARTTQQLTDDRPIALPQGTTVDISLHSALTVPTILHGLHQRPGRDKDAMTVALGATEHVRFVAGAPGTYLDQELTLEGVAPNDARRSVQTVISEIRARADPRTT